VERPLPGQRSIQRVIDVSDFAVATSGDYRNYFEQDGLRYSHTIDPRTGWPIRHSLASVTVLAEEAMLADAWATALMVLGEEEGYRFAEEIGLAAYFLYKQGDEFLPRETSSFTRMTTKQE
jgi:thiamine biosynthesis lipoprotein